MKKVGLIVGFFFIPVVVFGAEKISVVQGDVITVPLPESCRMSMLYIKRVGTFPVVTLEKQKSLLVATDIYRATTTSVIPACGTFATTTIEVVAKPKDVKQFTIPDTQGGNSAKNAIRVRNQLNRDATIFETIVSNKKQLWTEPFVYPVKNPVVTDPFGYGRDSKGVTILHKGLDLQAEVGTPIYAVNTGIVKYVGKLPMYGNTVVVDHGKGILSIYLHLSKTYVKEGIAVKRRNIIGTSGGTGFVVSPHLHISIRVSGASVNPQQFLNVLGDRGVEKKLSN